MRGASQYINIQQSSLAVSTNAPCTNATSESVFLIHEIIENKTLLRSSKLETLPAPGQKGTAPNTTCCRDAFVPATAAICTVCLSQLPWIHGHIPGSKSSDCSARSRHVKCIQTYVANCSNVAAHYLRHLVTIVVLAEWRLGTLAGFSSAQVLLRQDMESMKENEGE